MPTGSLYVVATPIGNLEDITARARRVLSEVDLIAAEDTRHSGRLLSQLQISTPLVALHDHNEKQFAPILVDRLKKGEDIALISDAGTPLLSDPGYGLIELATTNEIKIVPVVGASAVMAALSVGGMPVDRFVFEGFLPAKQQARLNRLQALVHESRTVVFFEAPHRVVKALKDIQQVFGDTQLVTVARELTKMYEQIVRKDVEAMLADFESGAIPVKGEFVLLLRREESRQINADLLSLLEVLNAELPPAKAAVIAHKLTGENKKQLYKMILELK